MEKLKKDEFPDQRDERSEASREINEEVEVAGVGGEGLHRAELI